LLFIDVNVTKSAVTNNTSVLLQNTYAVFNVIHVCVFPVWVPLRPPVGRFVRPSVWWSAFVRPFVWVASSPPVGRFPFRFLATFILCHLCRLPPLLRCFRTIHISFVSFICSTNNYVYQLQMCVWVCISMNHIHIHIWPLQDIVITRGVWCIAYKRRSEGESYTVQVSCNCIAPGWAMQVGVRNGRRVDAYTPAS